MLYSDLFAAIGSGKLDARFSEIYGREYVGQAKERYGRVLSEFGALYGTERDVSFFSVPGRSELSGNHTDHNHGKVIAGSVNLDIIAAASPRSAGRINLKSEGFPEDRVDLGTFCEPDRTHFGRSDALIAGVAAGMKAEGYAVGGFDAMTSSDVLKGSGLSSSAAFENMVGLILSHFYNGSSLDFVTVAKLSQYSENRFFGKPCGLMDQVACAAGGEVYIDFADPSRPVVEKLDFDFTSAGYRLCIVNTGGSHADLTQDYASVPAEMKSVAAALGKETLRDADEEIFRSRIPELREKLGDRAVLRALHFYSENRRVERQKKALLSGDIEGYFSEVLASGRSSFCYLQNVYSPHAPESQGIPLALFICDEFLSSLPLPSAYRVHGGGFAGTIQAYVPESAVAAFSERMTAVFGDGSVYVLKIRQTGAVRVI